MNAYSLLSLSLCVCVYVLSPKSRNAVSKLKRKLLLADDVQQMQ